MAGAVAAPQRRVDGAAVDALAPLREKLRHLDCATHIRYKASHSGSAERPTSEDTIKQYLQSINTTVSLHFLNRFIIYGSISDKGGDADARCDVI